MAKRPPISTTLAATDNVWDVDCSSFFPPGVTGENIHGAYFGIDGVTDGTIELMRQILRGIDCGVLNAFGATTGSADPRFLKPADGTQVSGRK